MSKLEVIVLGIKDSQMITKNYAFKLKLEVVLATLKNEERNILLYCRNLEPSSIMQSNHMETTDTINPKVLCHKSGCDYFKV